MIICLRRTRFLRSRQTLQDLPVEHLTILRGPVQAVARMPPISRNNQVTKRVFDEESWTLLTRSALAATAVLWVAGEKFFASLFSLLANFATVVIRKANRKPFQYFLQLVIGTRTLLLQAICVYFRRCKNVSERVTSNTSGTRARSA